MEIEPLIKEPTTLTFVTTEKCSSACSSCCFQCSPKRSKRLTKKANGRIYGTGKKRFPNSYITRADNVHSKSGDFQTKSLRWGASSYYTKKIGNPTLRNINQSLRNTKFPYDNWRTADPGHIHYKWRLNDEDSWHWFR